jgi:hypothetical protein
MTISLAAPQRIVLLGEIVKNNLLKHYPDAVCLHHPAYILRRGGRNTPDYREYTRAWIEIVKGLTW